MFGTENLPFELPPVLEARFVLADGTELARSWGLGEEIPPGLEKPPVWLEDPLRGWSDPSKPILLTGKVKAGHEDEAREALGLGEGCCVGHDLAAENARLREALHDIDTAARVIVLNKEDDQARLDRILLICGYALGEISDA